MLDSCMDMDALMLGNAKPVQGEEADRAAQAAAAAASAGSSKFPSANWLSIVSSIFEDIYINKTTSARSS